MAKTVPEASNGTNPIDHEVSASRTPAGVWLIVGMAVLFVVGGLGISAFIVWKAIGIKQSVLPLNRAAGQSVKPVPTAPAWSEGQVGVEHPSPNLMVEETGPTPVVGTNRAEENRVRQEVLQRIDLLRVLTDAEKDKLYAQVERAKGFVKIAIIPFTQNRTIVGPAQIEALIKSLNGLDLRKLLADPTVALIMVGYADKKGDEAKNLEISRNRAESVVKALKEKMDLANVMHAVGMGGQEIFDTADLEKNRVVEVWAVEP